MLVMLMKREILFSSASGNFSSSASLNLPVLASGQQVTHHKIDSYAPSNLPAAPGSVQYGGTYASSAYMMSRRLIGEFADIGRVTVHRVKSKGKLETRNSCK